MPATTIVTQQQLKQLTAELTEIGEQLETIPNGKQWFTVARAAALLESIRLGLATVEPQPFIYGIDFAVVGSDRSAHHA